jgi:hypothetical protein
MIVVRDAGENVLASSLLNNNTNIEGTHRYSSPWHIRLHWSF